MTAIAETAATTIPFTLNRASPGNKVAHLVVTLSSSAPPGSTISLTLDTSLTQLTDQGGTAATKETVANLSLSLVNGAINIAATTVTLSPSSKTVPLNGTGTLRATLSRAAAGNTTVSLNSSNSSVASVPASVVVPDGATSAEVSVSGVAVGTAKITATLGSSTSISNVTVTDCNTPSAPVVTAPASVEAGTTYTVSWGAVSGATEYIVDESTDQAFTSPTSQTVTTTSATFSHTPGGTSYYYRVRAHTLTGSCNLFSPYSAAVSVQISATPLSVTRVLAVVGSLQGNFGSFFRTSVRLFNPKSDAVSGRIVFHPAGASGSVSDPSLPISIEPGKTLSFADLLPAMGVASGIGSADVIADPASPFPAVLARVFNDAGDAGTTGLAEDALPLDSALRTGQSGALIAPLDVQKFRLNIGVRTLDQGSAMTFTVRDADGTVVKTVSKEFAPTFFTQISSAAMLDGYALTGGETITIDVTSGAAFVYGATTDNTTNDPSVQFAGSID